MIPDGDLRPLPALHMRTPTQAKTCATHTEKELYEDVVLSLHDSQYGVYILYFLEFSKGNHVHPSDLVNAGTAAISLVALNSVSSLPCGTPHHICAPKFGFIYMETGGFGTLILFSDHNLKLPHT